MRNLIIMLTLCVPAVVSAQARPNLYECEGCEAIHEKSFKGLGWHTRVAPAGEPGEPLTLSGRVFKTDGKTPAPGVVVYIHHTNTTGTYPKRGDETGWGRRHGYLRAWAVTNERGEYQFDTIRPGIYPNRGAPAHIHLIIKEPNRREYWIDDVVFTDDALVTPEYRARAENRGGNGIVTPRRDASGTWIVQRNIILEK
jgi:protocatechuate 3,4-dioxygenase, beta subunit